MHSVSTQNRQRLELALDRGQPLTPRQRTDLVECLHMIDRLQTDLRVALADNEGKIQDNNFLLIGALSLRAENSRLKHRIKELEGK